MDGDVVLSAQGADTSPRPAVAVAGRLAPSVEHCGDRLVRHLARQGAHKLDDITVGAPARPPSAVLLHRQTRMIATLPVNDQLQRVADDIDDDLRDDGSDDLLARFSRGSLAIPGGSQISASERHETFPIGAGENLLRHGVELINLDLELVHRDQPLIPPSLQLGRHKPVVRIDGVVLALRASRLIASLPQGELELISLLRALLAACVNSRQGRFHAQRLETVEHLLGHHSVGAHAAEGDTPRCGELVERSDTLETRCSIAVADMKLAPTPRAAEEANQQGFASADGTAGLMNRLPLALSAIEC